MSWVQNIKNTVVSVGVAAVLAGCKKPIDVEIGQVNEKAYGVAFFDDNYKPIEVSEEVVKLYMHKINPSFEEVANAMGVTLPNNYNENYSIGNYGFADGNSKVIEILPINEANIQRLNRGIYKALTTTNPNIDPLDQLGR